MDTEETRIGTAIEAIFSPTQWLANAIHSPILNEESVFHPWLKTLSVFHRKNADESDERNLSLMALEKGLTA